MYTFSYGINQVIITTQLQVRVSLYLYSSDPRSQSLIIALITIESNSKIAISTHSQEFHLSLNELLKHENPHSSS